MKTSEWVRDQLEHVRLIHFSMLLVSGTLGYMVWLGWSDATEVARELHDFQYTAHRLYNLSNEPTYLASALPDWTSTYAAQLKSMLPKELRPENLKSFDGRAAAATSAPVLVKPLPPMSELRLRELLDVLQKAEWKVTLISGFPESEGLSKLRSKVAAVHCPYVSIATLKSIRVNEDLQGESNHRAEVLFDEGDVVVPSPDDPFPTYQIEVTETKVVLPCNIIESSVKLDSNWFETKFIHLKLHWQEIQEMRFLDAIKWADKLRTEALKEQNPEVLGVKLRGRDIGIVGPIALLMMFLYLISYLENLRESLAAQGVTSSVSEVAISSLSPWIGCMQNWYAAIMTSVTLVAAPSVPLFFSFWRLVGWPVLYCVLPSLAALFLGLLGMHLGRVVSKQQLIESQEHQ